MSQYTFFKKNIILQNNIFYPSSASLFGIDTDSKPLQNIMKVPSLNALKSTTFLNSSWVKAESISSEVLTHTPFNNYIIPFFNKNEFSKFKNLKSNDLQFLSNERNTRLLGTSNSNSFNHNFSAESTNFNSLWSSVYNQQVGTPQNNIYLQSLLQWPHTYQYPRIANNSTWLPSSHTPIVSNKPNFSITSYDLYSKGTSDTAPSMFKSKDESAPSHIFSTY